MIELRFSKVTPQGYVKGIYRFIGKYIFIKKINPQNSAQVISQLKEKGAKIEESRGWIKIDIFNDNEECKLGEKQFNIKEMKDEEIESILSEFYTEQFKKGGFHIEVEMQNDKR